MKFEDIKIGAKGKCGLLLLSIACCYGLVIAISNLGADEVFIEDNTDNGYIMGKDQFAFKHPRYTREKLGHQAWEILHLISAFVPNKLSTREERELNTFLKLFGKYYPCKECGGHWLALVKEKPFSGKTKQDFMRYLCERHNDVNKRLGKDEFPCNLVERAWGQVGCGCEPSELVEQLNKDSN